MALLEYNEAVERKYIVLDGQPYEVISSHVFRKQQRKPVNATKLKNLFTGKVAEHSFHQSEKIEEAEIETKEVKYLYNTKGMWWFCDPENQSQRFSVPGETVGDAGRFIKTNTIIDMMSFNEKIIGFKMPITVDLKVTEAMTTVAGDTVKGGVKQVTLETGTTINVPMFVKEGDVIRINTETGEYRERV